MPGCLLLPPFLLLLFTSLLAGPCAGFNPKDINFDESDAALHWEPASATWYGAPTGAGPDDNGGACGFKHTNTYPFNSMTSCGNAPIFKGGHGCGSCFKVRCTKKDHPLCSGKAHRVVITDLNDGPYPYAAVHFDMSGTAFGALAVPGHNDQLRHAGRISMEFARIPCEFPGLKIAFHVEEHSNPMYFAVLIEYEDGDGDVSTVDLMESTAHGNPTGVWTPMRESWGSIYRLDSHRPLQPPFSLRIRNEHKQTLVAKEVIPANYVPNTVYRSFVQYS